MNLNYYLRRALCVNPNASQLSKVLLCRYSGNLSFVNSQQGTENIKTIKEVKDELRTIMGVQRGYHPIEQNRSHLLNLLPNSQDELPPRSVKDSYDVAVIPLGKDFGLQDKYVNFLGFVRLGRLLEDLDMFAVHIIFKHLLNPKLKEGDRSPAVIATVLVDEISISPNRAQHDKDIRINGYVSQVGSSSAEVTIFLDQFVNGSWTKLLRALFVMVARNSTMSKSTFLNKLVPQNDEEKIIITEANERAKQRKKVGLISLLKEPPNQEEQQLIHDMFLKSSDIKDVRLDRRILPSDGAKWMMDTKVSNCILCQPEDRNLHNKIFGGFLMRNAIELAFMTAFIHCKQLPIARFCSEITFNHPVDVGSFLRMTGMVAYTNKQFMQVTIYNEIQDPFTSKLTTSNVFNYTYESPSYVPSVVPSTYSEAMMYIDARRHFYSSVHK